ncbi:MAG TPA: asparagine synthase (glutamine-hydrolyzing) [Thermodesulfobacteriota bacterium]|nr:asparagine synthase (glutamine-hydrolyzing) [Thermodesulfobacteriota bacterium]
MGKFFGIIDGENLVIQDIFSDEGDKLWVSYEGEIYNSDEIRLSSESFGYRFNPGAYSELIAKAYKTWGEDFAKRLNGAFSICIIDKEKEILYLIRDQVGRKPVYFSDANGRFAFSSDVKSLLEIPSFPREIDLRALNFYLTYRYIPQELSIFNHIRRLPAGCALRLNLRSREIKKWSYWEPPTVEERLANEDELLKELEKIIEDAIRIRMRGNSHTGAFLSGGLDSSLIVAMMSRLSSNTLKTFSVGYNDEKYNEIPFSRIVSRYFATDHEEFIIEPDFDAFLESCSFFDEPLGDPSIIPTYYAMKLGKKYVDSVISGDGADGLFLGFRTHYLSSRYEEIKRYMIPPFEWLSGAVAGILPQEVKWRIFFENKTPEDLFLTRGIVFNAHLRKRLFKNWVLDELFREHFSEPEIYGTSTMNSYSGTLSGKMAFLTFKSDPDDILFKIDKISRNLSLNVRTPFLDTRLVEFALGKVPGNMKIRGDKTKYILKRLGAKFLPKELPLDRKRGFNPPLFKSLRKEWSHKARDILMEGEDNFLIRVILKNLLIYIKILYSMKVGGYLSFLTLKSGGMGT